MSHSVIIKNIVKYYGDFLAADHLNLEIRNGEFFTLLGPSGCGKTTLLRMIAGFNTIESGEILFDDKIINNTPSYKRDIGMVFQDYAIFPHLDVKGNVAYGLRARKVPRDRIDAMVMDALKLVQIEHLKDRMPNELSGGQRQRVALARAFVIKPTVLLMDEPLSNLDAKLRVQMRTVIRKLQRNLGITTIYVTHDQEEALSISDRIAIMEEGKIMQVGSPMEIYMHPINPFVANFIGVSNFIPCQIKDGTVVLENGYSFKKTFSRQFSCKARLFVRPEFLYISNNDRGLKGEIVMSTFLGDFVQHEIKLDGGQIIQMNEYTKGDIPSIRPSGEKINILVNTTSCGLFSAETGEAII